MFMACEERRTKAWHSNLNKSTHVRVAGPSTTDAEYLNLYFDKDTWCLHREDVQWLRDRLIERFPLSPQLPTATAKIKFDFVKEEPKKDPQFKVEYNTITGLYDIIENKITKVQIARCAFKNEAERIAKALNNS